MLYECDPLCPGQLGSVWPLLGGPAASEIPRVGKSLHAWGSLMRAWTPASGLCRQSCFLFGCGSCGVEEGEPDRERRRHSE